MISRHASSVPKRRCCLSLAALQWFEALPGMFSAPPGLFLVLPDLSLTLPGLSLVVHGAPTLVVSAPRCSLGRHQSSYGHLDWSPVLPGAPEGHRICAVHSGIWPPWDSGSTTSWHSQRLPEAPRGSHIQKYILLMSKFAPWWPPSTQSSSSGAPWILPTHHVQPVQIYCV